MIEEAPLPKEVTEEIADQLRTLADDIEGGEVYGGVRYSLDTEPRRQDGVSVDYAIHGSEIELDIFTERFNIDLTVYDNLNDND